MTQERSGVGSDMEACIDTFMSNLPEMLKHHEGKLTAIARDGTSAGYYDTSEQALEQGYSEFGIDQVFLLRKVSQEYLEHGKYGKPVSLPG